MINAIQATDEMEKFAIEYAENMYKEVNDSFKLEGIKGEILKQALKTCVLAGGSKTMKMVMRELTNERK